MGSLEQIRNEMKRAADAKKAAVLQRFFKTGPGEYGEGDVFLGITVPKTRAIAKKHRDLGLHDIKKLLNSEIHEERLAALLILIEKYKEGDEKNKKIIYDFYVSMTHRINNWDLVDLSAHHIVGEYLRNRDKALLDRFATSRNVWERRIAMVATYAYIRENEFDAALRVAERLLRDEHDLIHKAVGWMLREIGKRDVSAEEAFLKKHYRNMKRTALRYAIERFSEKKKKFYMRK